MKIALIALATVFSTALWAQVAPVGAQITGVTMAGGGCRDATASVTLSPNGQNLSILFDSFILIANASNVNSKTLRSEISCTTYVDIQIPQGWSMALVGVDYRGFASIPEKTVGYQRFLYQAPMMPITSLREASAAGPYSGNYQFAATQKPSRYSWTPCGMTQIRLPMTAVIGIAYQVRGYYPEAQVVLDSQDLSMAQHFQVAWRQCR